MTYTEEEYNEVLRSTAAALQAKDATIAAITAERDAHAKTIADFLACDDAGKAKMLADAAKSAEQKERDAAQAEFDAAKAKLDAAKAKLDEIPAQ
jgi:hypothetical protein